MAAADILKAYFASFREHDWKAKIPHFFTEDAEYICFATERMSPETKFAIPWAGVWKGHQGVIDFQTLLNENFEVRGFEDHTYIEDGDNIAMFGVLKFTARATNRNVDSDMAAHVKLRDGRIAYYHFYEDTFAIVHAFRTGGQWTIDNGAGGHNLREAPGATLRGAS